MVADIPQISTSLNFFINETLFVTSTVGRKNLNFALLTKNILLDYDLSYYNSVLHPFCVVFYTHCLTSV